MMEVLQRQKLAAEIEKLSQETRKLEQEMSLGFWLSILTPVVTLLAAGLALYGVNRTARIQATNHNEQLESNRFRSVVEDLGGAQSGARLGAAALLRSFLHRGRNFEQYYVLVFDLAASHLRSPAPPYPPATRADPFFVELGRALAEAYRRVHEQERWQQVILHRGRRQFDTRRLDASRIQLPYGDLSGAHLTGITMPDAKLRSADLTRANLRSANLERTDLQDTRLPDAILVSARLRFSSISGAQLVRADLCLADLTGAKGAPLRLPGQGPKSTDFSNAVMRKTILAQAELTGASFVDSRMDRVIMPGATLTDARFVRAKLAAAELGGATLDGATFDRAIMRGAVLTGASLRNTTFLDCDLAGANPEAARNLEGTIFSGETGLTQDQFQKCQDRGADVSKARPRH